MSPRNNAVCIGNYCDAVLSGEITSASCWRSSLRYIVACVLLRIILTELDREIAGPGWCVNADGLGSRQRAMETAQHRDRLPKNQPAEITMFQISEVQESPVFNGRRSFLTLRSLDVSLSDVFVANRTPHKFQSPR